MNPTLKKHLFAAESAAHLQGLEHEILPLADYARAQDARIKALEDALTKAEETIQGQAEMLRNCGAAYGIGATLKAVQDARQP